MEIKSTHIAMRPMWRSFHSFDLKKDVKGNIRGYVEQLLDQFNVRYEGDLRFLNTRMTESRAGSTNKNSISFQFMDDYWEMPTALIQCNKELMPTFYKNKTLVDIDESSLFILLRGGYKNDEFHLDKRFKMEVFFCCVNGDKIDSVVDEINNNIVNQPKDHSEVESLMNDNNSDSGEQAPQAAEAKADSFRLFSQKPTQAVQGRTYPNLPEALEQHIKTCANEVKKLNPEVKSDFKLPKGLSVIEGYIKCNRSHVVPRVPVFVGPFTYELSALVNYETGQVIAGDDLKFSISDIRCAESTFIKTLNSTVDYVNKYISRGDNVNVDDGEVRKMGM